MALVVLTDSCNLSCRACFRPREPARDVTPWSFTELESCLNELVSAGQSSVAYSGGEPSLWRDGRKTFTDLLVTSSRVGLSVMFVTNGYPFRDYDNTRTLLDGYFGIAQTPLHVVVSVDRWHDGTWAEGRSPALESLLRWLEAHADTNRLEVEVASLWCLDDSYNIPPQDFAKYKEAGIKISHGPLSPIGRAQGLSELAPALSAHGTCKVSLGSYGEVLRGKMGITEEDWSTLPNSKLYGPCLAVTTLTLDMDRRYWLCCDRAGESLCVAPAGRLTAESLEACLARNPIVKSFLDAGFVDAIRECAEGSGALSPAPANALLKQRHHYGISGRASCGLCRHLPPGCFS